MKKTLVAVAFAVATTFAVSASAGQVMVDNPFGDDASNGHVYEIMASPAMNGAMMNMPTPMPTPMMDKPEMGSMMDMPKMDGAMMDKPAMGSVMDMPGDVMDMLADIWEVSFANVFGDDM